MAVLMRPWGHLHYREGGDPAGQAVVFVPSLGTDLRMWDGVAARLAGVRTIGIDTRGHGLSATPGADWEIGDLTEDVVALLDHLEVPRAAIAGCSVGGMVAQDMGARYPDRVTALVLSNTAPKIGTVESWAARIAAVRAGGMNGIADAVLARWFAPPFLATPEAAPWATLLRRCDPTGYIGMCGALARADLTAGLGRIQAPVLVIGGTDDQSTPPDLVKVMAKRISDARHVTLDGSGHLPAIDAPGATARVIAAFLKETLHV